MTNMSSHVQKDQATDSAWLNEAEPERRLHSSSQEEEALRESRCVWSPLRGIRLDRIQTGHYAIRRAEILLIHSWPVHYAGHPVVAYSGQNVIQQVATKRRGFQEHLRPAGRISLRILEDYGHGQLGPTGVGELTPLQGKMSPIVRAHQLLTFPVIPPRIVDIHAHLQELLSLTQLREFRDRAFEIARARGWKPGQLKSIEKAIQVLTEAGAASSSSYTASLRQVVKQMMRITEEGISYAHLQYDHLVECLEKAAAGQPVGKLYASSVDRAICHQIGRKVPRITKRTDLGADEVAVAAPARRAEPEETPEMKNCLFCDEWIRIKAVFCKHCRRDQRTAKEVLGDDFSEPAEKTSAPKPETPAARHKRERRQRDREADEQSASPYKVSLDGEGGGQSAAEILASLQQKANAIDDRTEDFQPDAAPDAILNGVNPDDPEG
jgi:hypothetical protein